MSSLTPGNVGSVVQHARTQVKSDAQRQVFAEFLRQAVLLGDPKVQQLAFTSLNVLNAASDKWRIGTLGRLIQALPHDKRDLGGLSAETRHAVQELLTLARQSAGGDSVSSVLRLAAIASPLEFGG